MEVGVMANFQLCLTFPPWPNSTVRLLPAVPLLQYNLPLSCIKRLPFRLLSSPRVRLLHSRRHIVFCGRSYAALFARRLFSFFRLTRAPLFIAAPCRAILSHETGCEGGLGGCEEEDVATEASVNCTFCTLCTFREGRVGKRKSA
jgi:hypothetical protein